MNYLFQNYGAGYGFGFPAWAPGILILLLIWSFFWKGLALWHSARRRQGRWFIALLLVNTMGFLELIYLFLVAKVPTSELFSSEKNS